MTLFDHLATFFQKEAPVRPGDLVVVAFSGGTDSLALLWGLTQVAPRLGMRLGAAHLDHDLDANSGTRAVATARLARDLGVPVVTGREPVRRHKRQGESLEAAARRVRYRFLEEVRQDLAGRYVATAHHRDDQAETVVLRLLQGSGLEGLAGIRPRRGPLVRPLLELTRSDLATSLAATGLVPLQDPTNFDLRFSRNRIRHRVLPGLRSLDPSVDERLAHLAAAASGANRRIVERLLDHLRTVSAPGRVAIPVEAFERLPRPLRPHALALLHRCAGAPYPASAAARRELLRQLATGKKIGCDCGGGWRWEKQADLMVLRRRRASVPVFTYTLEVPGELEIPELSLVFSLRLSPVAPWMFQGRADRAAMVLPLREGERVTIRNRRPGDRVWPLGCPESRRLKDVLINRRVPRDDRDRLPLLCVSGEIAWVPGVTIDERLRLAGQETAWVAEVTKA